MRHRFSPELADAERLAPFGEVAEIHPGRWAFRVGVKRELGEDYNDATARILMGPRGMASHPDCVDMRLLRDIKDGWVGAAGPDAGALEAIMAYIAPYTTGALVPGPVARRMMARL